MGTKTPASSNGKIVDAVDEALFRAYPLTDDERELLETIQSLDRATWEQYVRPIQERYARLARRIERRVGLPEGALTSTPERPGTHQINDRMEVEPVPRT